MKIFLAGNFAGNFSQMANVKNNEYRLISESLKRGADYHRLVSFYYAEVVSGGQYTDNAIKAFSLMKSKIGSTTERRDAAHQS
jgi:hypothetical protein